MKKKQVNRKGENKYPRVTIRVKHNQTFRTPPSNQQVFFTLKGAYFLNAPSITQIHSHQA